MTCLQEVCTSMITLNKKDSSAMYAAIDLGNSVFISLSRCVWFGYIFSQNHPKEWGLTVMQFKLL